MPLIRFALVSVNLCQQQVTYFGASVWRFVSHNVDWSAWMDMTCVVYWPRWPAWPVTPVQCRLLISTLLWRVSVHCIAEAPQIIAAATRRVSCRAECTVEGAGPSRCLVRSTMTDKQRHPGGWSVAIKLDDTPRRAARLGSSRIVSRSYK